MPEVAFNAAAKADMETRGPLAITIGKTNTPELGVGSRTFNKVLPLAQIPRFTTQSRQSRAASQGHNREAHVTRPGQSVR